MTSEDITLIKPVRTALTMRSLSTGETYPLNGELLIGREVECHVRLNSPTISRYHAKISIAANGAYIEDLHSSNGTFVNGHRVTARVRLALGDEISFENIAFRITNLDSGDEDATRLTPKSSREILDARVAKMQLNPGSAASTQKQTAPLNRPAPEVARQQTPKAAPQPAPQAKKPQPSSPPEAPVQAETKDNRVSTAAKPVEPQKANLTPETNQNAQPKPAAENIAAETPQQPSKPQQQTPQISETQAQKSNVSFAETIEALKNPEPIDIDDLFDDIKEKFGQDSVDSVLTPEAFNEIDEIQEAAIGEKRAADPDIAAPIAPPVEAEIINSAPAALAPNVEKEEAKVASPAAEAKPTPQKSDEINKASPEQKAPQPSRKDLLTQDLKKLLEDQNADGDNTELVSRDQMSRIAERNIKLKRDLQIGTGPRLVIMSAPTRGKVFPLEIKDDKLEWMIGRNPKAQIHIPEQAISHDHARITLEEEGFVIANTHATNGMLINGKFTNKKLLTHNDTIQIGRMELVFKTDAWEPPKEETHTQVKHPEKGKSHVGAYVGAGVILLAVLLALVIGK